MSAEPRYVNFDLLIERQGSEFRARVTDSPAGEAWAVFPPPVQELEAQNLRLLSMGRRTVRAVDAHVETTARDIGERLFRGAFRDGVLECYVKSRAWAEQEKVRLRIRLRLADPDAQQLPWEYLRDPSSGGKFLGLDRDTPIVRYMEVARPKPVLHVEGALRILAVISTPTDLDGLDAEREWRNLQQALAPLIDRKAVSLHRLQPTTFAALEQEIEREDYHVVHFVGHGGYDPQTQDGVLVFTGDDGASLQISSDQLGPILGDEDTLKLAVLNACEGAVAKGKDIFAGCAQRLVGHGIPAVVAMQAEITDTAAIDFSARFYGSLAEGRPVDGALVDARKAIFARPNPVEWGTPVLYMRAGDGRLFELGAPLGAAAAAATPPPSPRPPAPPTPQPIITGPGGDAASLVTPSGLHIPPSPGPRLWDQVLTGAPNAAVRNVLAGAAGAFLVLLVVGQLVRTTETVSLGVSTPAPIPTVATAETIARDVVADFWQLVDRGEYLQAWSLRSDGWKADKSYTDFEDEFADTLRARFTPGQVVSEGPSVVRVEGTITTIEDSSGEREEVLYDAKHWVRLVGGRWLLDDAQFAEVRRRAVLSN